MRLKDSLAQGKLTRVFCLGQLCSPKLAEMIGLVGGYDAVWLDQEHVGLSVSRLEEAARGARAGGIDSFVRLAPTDYATVMRPLEAGAGGIMAAQVRSAAQAAEIVRWSRFHPIGQRGFNSSGIDGRYGATPMAEYMRYANEQTFVAIQIEHAEAVEQVEAIAALRGIDCLFIGPADLSQSYGIPGEWEHPRLWQAIERVARAAAAQRVPWAILPMSPSAARRCIELGCRMLSLGMDVWAFAKGLTASKAEYAEFFAM